jgi:hypothetical protein
MQTQTFSAMIALALLLGTSPLGCAQTSKTEVSTKTTRSGDRGAAAKSESVQEKTTVTAKAPDPCNGLLGCTVEFAGEAIALPFRLVSGLVRAIL